MDEVVIIIMRKDMESGILSDEIATCKIYGNEAYLSRIFAVGGDGLFTAHIELSTEDIEDWEFDAIYDHYDSGIFDGKADSVTEITDCVNPTWEVLVRFTIEECQQSDGVVCNGITALENRLNDILCIHAAEIKEVYGIIKDKKDEYI